MAKIECSDKLKNRIDAMSVLVDQLCDYFDDASILGSDTRGKTFQVSRNDTSLRDFSGNECGFVVRVLKHGRYFEYSFNEWLEIEELYKTILDQYQLDQQIQKETGLENYDVVERNDAMVYESYETTVQRTLKDTTMQDVLKSMEKVRDIIIQADNRVANVAIILNNVHVSKAFISSCKELCQGYMYSEVIVQVTVRDGQKVQTDIKMATGLLGLEVLDQLEAKAKEALDDALALLDAKPMIPGTYDVICSPEISGLIAHEAFGHGVEMDMFVKNRALAKDYIGKQVASPLVTMVDGTMPKQEVASYLFDDEGNLGQETVLIKDGILISGINDAASAMRLGTKPTGNGRRESFERKAYARMTNTYFDKGDSKLEDMIASCQYGFLLEGVDSGMEDPKHWGIQCIISKAKEIVDGKLTGNIYSPVILTGYVPDLLKSITMVGNEVELCGGGMCGKGYKEWVKVSDGGPYLKAKARLG